jgi:hypothetical protein
MIPNRVYYSSRTGVVCRICDVSETMDVLHHQEYMNDHHAETGHDFFEIRRPAFIRDA